MQTSRKNVFFYVNIKRYAQYLSDKRTVSRGQASKSKERVELQSSVTYRQKTTC